MVSFFHKPTRSPVTISFAVIFVMAGFLLSQNMVFSATESKWASSHITGTFTNPNNALGATDAVWAGPTLNTNASQTSRWAMENPSSSITGTQTINIIARKGSNSGTPTIALNLYENGTLVQSIVGATSVTSTSGQTITGTFNASMITTPANAEVQIVMTGVGGNSSTRNSAQIDSIEWVVNFITPAVPTVTSPTVTSITTTGATLGANVTSLGVPAVISARGTCWGTSASPTTNCVAEGGTTTGVFTHARTGMSPGVFYYYRGYATNSTGTGYSADGTFTTTATASGSVSASPSTCTISSGASTCTVPFTWSISNATSPNIYNASTTNTYSTSASGTGVSYPITNGANTVQVRDSTTVLNSTTATGSCISGTSWNGSTCAMTPAVPTVTTPTATSITTTGATLGANVTSLGVPAVISAHGTCWGTSASPTTNCLAEGGTTTGVFTHARTGMSPNTFYYYRGYATNSTGTGYSADGTFTTPGATFAITATAGANGSVTPGGVTNVAQGGSQAYAITPDIGYDVETLIIDGGSVATSTTYTFTNMQAIHTIHATFVILATPPVTHTITSSAGSNGAINPLGAIVVADTANQTFNIIPDSGFTIDTLVVDGGGVATSTSYTFTNVTADHTISATFALIPPPLGSFTIIANQNPNGTVAPSGSTVVTEGSSQAYSITPNGGYDVGSIIVDSSPISSTSTSYTFTNITADHTIEATFTALPGTAPVVIRVRRLASVTFQGRAFPDGKISVVQNDLGNEITTSQQGTTDGNGFFNIRFTDLQTGAHSFGLLIKDPDGRSSQTKFFVVDVSRGDEVFKDIVTPPTVDILNGQVSRGGNLKVFGYASPGHTIRVYINDILAKETLAGRGGVYSFDIPTGVFDFGQHRVRAKQINLDGGKESDFSTERTFIVSKLTVVKADFSGDGKIDITDWSIFLARWGSKSSLGREGIDLNSDGKIDISDFSIFIKTIRKK